MEHTGKRSLILNHILKLKTMPLTIEKHEAKRLLPDAPEWLKRKLIEEFGEEITKQKDFENIKTFEDACAKFKVHPDDVFNERDMPDEIAYKKLKLIIRAINNGWVPDWKNESQKKWVPWFVLSSGFGFDSSDYYYGNSHTDAGSRLCFESDEKSTYAANQFLNLYEEFLTIK